MRVKFTNVYRDQTLPGGLRTTSVEGECEGIPDIGKTFRLIAAPLMIGGTLRYIETSRIAEMDILDHIVTITTESGSIYTIEVLDEIV